MEDARQDETSVMLVSSVSWTGRDLSRDECHACLIWIFGDGVHSSRQRHWDKDEDVGG